MTGGGDIAKTEADVTLMQLGGPAPPPRHWNRGTWIRFLLAITPTVVLAVLGYLQTH